MTPINESTPLQIKLWRETAERRARLGMKPKPQPKFRVTVAKVEPKPEPLPVQIPPRRCFPPNFLRHQREELKAAGIAKATIIRKIVAAAFNVRDSDITDKSRNHKSLLPRQISMYLCRELLPLATFTYIARFHGRKDHTTVINAIEKVRRTMQSESAMRGMINDIQRQIEETTDVVETRIQPSDKTSSVGTQQGFLPEVWRNRYAVPL